MLNSFKKHGLWPMLIVAGGLMVANYAVGFWPFSSPKVIWSQIAEIPADCGKGFVLQSINPRICVPLPGSSSDSTGATSGAGGSGGGVIAGGPGCTGNATSGPGVTTGTAICGVLCPANKTAKIIKYTGAGTPFVSFDQAQGKYICNGKPSLGASSIQCECQ